MLLILAAMAGVAQADGYDEAQRCYEAGATLERKLESCTRAIHSGDLGPEALAAVLFERANAYRRMGDDGRAVDDFALVIRLDPEDTDARLNRGNAYADLGNYAAALADYDAVIARRPGDARAYNNRCDLGIRMGRYDEAIGDCNAAIGLDPNDAFAHYNRALALARRGDGARARADFERAFALEPDHPAIRRAMRELGRLERSRLAAPPFAPRVTDR